MLDVRAVLQTRTLYDETPYLNVLRKAVTAPEEPRFRLTDYLGREAGGDRQKSAHSGLLRRASIYP